MRRQTAASCPLHPEILHWGVRQDTVDWKAGFLRSKQEAGEVINMVSQKLVLFLNITTTIAAGNALLFVQGGLLPLD